MAESSWYAERRNHTDEIGRLLMNARDVAALVTSATTRRITIFATQPPSGSFRANPTALTLTLPVQRNCSPAEFVRSWLMVLKRSGRRVNEQSATSGLAPREKFAACVGSTLIHPEKYAPAHFFTRQVAMVPVDAWVPLYSVPVQDRYNLPHVVAALRGRIFCFEIFTPKSAGSRSPRIFQTYRRLT